jgi:ribonucleoside-triphosphate reductase
MAKKFRLRESFIETYKTIKPPFGFNGLGELTYMRTYSRIKENGHNEKWWETIRRVVEGTYRIQERHINENGLGWSDYKAQKSAQEMFDRMFYMKFLPPGRGLWAMGTSLTEERGLYAALNNCAFVSTENIGLSNEETSKPFEFLMDMSMLGVGVGFDVKGEKKISLYEPKREGVFTIPDTREGWVEAMAITVKAFLCKNHTLPEMDPSLIRKEGTPIKTFGGTASGPKPLLLLLEQITSVLQGRAGERITQTDIVDIMNMIGCCVIAGNVRRTAEIVFGDPNSDEYLKLKDYKWDDDQQKSVGSMAHRAAYGWTSNNSVFAELGMDYTKVATQTAVNGEIGYAWLENMRQFGRMIDSPNWKDKKAKGGNPCLEQTLESFELCCLVETFPTNHDDVEDYKRTLKFAYLYAKTVTLGNTHWSETNRVMLRNRRIGTSQSGIAQFVDQRGLEEYRVWCDEGYKMIQEHDKEYSDWLCIPLSIKSTSTKPSGTISLLPGVTPGMHYPEAKWYIRRIRIAEDSLLIQKCIDAGYHVERDVVSARTMVVEVPILIDGVRTVNEVSMWEQMSLAAFIQKWWADNQVSCTVTFQKHEGSQIKEALNYFQYQLKGISFLPKTEKAAYAQMPYEEVSEERYYEMIKGITPLDFSGMSEDSSPEKYCDGAACEIEIK